MTDTPSPGASPLAPTRPWWADLVPDARGWVAIGLFGLSAYVLWLLSAEPGLAQSQLFTALATAIVVSGLIGGVVAFLFGSSKSSAETRAQLGQALDKLPDGGGQP